MRRRDVTLDKPTLDGLDVRIARAIAAGKKADLHFGVVAVGTDVLAALVECAREKLAAKQ
jgi:hypothetical protein